MYVPAPLPAKADRDHLAAFRVVAKTGRVGHTDEFIFDDQLGHLKRRWNHLPQRVRLGAVSDDEEFAVRAGTPDW